MSGIGSQRSGKEYLNRSSTKNFSPEPKPKAMAQVLKKISRA